LWNNGLSAKTTREMYNIDPEFVAKQLKSAEKDDWNKESYAALNESNKNICRKKYFNNYASDDIKNLYYYHLSPDFFENLSKKSISILKLYKILYPNNDKKLDITQSIEEPLKHMNNKNASYDEIMVLKQYIVDNYINNTDTDLFQTTENIASYLNDTFKNNNLSNFFKHEVKNGLIRLSKDDIKKSQKSKEKEINQISQLSHNLLEFIEEVLSTPLNNIKDINEQINSLHLKNFIKKYDLNADIISNFINTESIEEFFTNIATQIVNEKSKIILSNNFKQSYQQFIDNLLSQIQQQYDSIQKSIFTQAFLSGKYQKIENVNRKQILDSALSQLIHHIERELDSRADEEYSNNKSSNISEKWDIKTLQTISDLSKDEQFLSELNKLIDFITFLSKSQMTTDGAYFYFKNADNNKTLRSSQINISQFYQGRLSTFYKTYIEDKNIKEDINNSRAINVANTLLDANYSNEQYNKKSLWNDNICTTIDESDEFINYLNSKNFSLDINEQNYQDKAYIINLYIDNNINNCQEKLFDFSAKRYFESHNPKNNEILSKYKFLDDESDKAYSSIEFLIKYIQENKLVKDVFDFFLRNKMRFYDNFQPDVHGKEMPAVYKIGQYISAKHFNVYKVGKEIPKFMVQEFQLRVPNKIYNDNSILRYLNNNPGKTRDFVSYLLSAMNTKQDKKSIVVEFFPNNLTRYRNTKELYTNPGYYNKDTKNNSITYFTTRDKLEKSYNIQEKTNNRNLMYHILFDIIKEEETSDGFKYDIVPDNMLINKTHTTDKNTNEKYYKLTTEQIFLPLSDYIKQNIINKGQLAKQRNNMTPEEQKSFDDELSKLSVQYDPTRPEYYDRMKEHLNANKQNRDKYLQSIKIENLQPFSRQAKNQIEEALEQVENGEMSLPSDICAYLKMFINTEKDWNMWSNQQYVSKRKNTNPKQYDGVKYTGTHLAQDDKGTQDDHILISKGQLYTQDKNNNKKEPKNGKLGDFK
jgi:hypothetical protein